MGASSTQKNAIKNLDNEDEDDEEETIKSFYNAYLSIKQIQELINKFKVISFEAYLISTDSIPNFIKIIKSSKVFENINNKNELKNSELVLKKNLENYELENNIKIIYEYNEIEKIMKNDKEKENEFIIFLKSLLG